MGEEGGRKRGGDGFGGHTVNEAELSSSIYAYGKQGGHSSGDDSCMEVPPTLSDQWETMGRGNERMSNRYKRLFTPLVVGTLVLHPRRFNNREF